MDRTEVSTFVRNVADRERALAKATRQRLSQAATPETDAALRSNMMELIATIRAVLPKLPDEALRAELEAKIARHEAHLGRMQTGDK